MSSLDPGSRLSSTAGATEVIVVCAPVEDVELWCGGHPMVPSGQNGSTAEVDPRFAGGSDAGTLYVDDRSGLEVFCTIGGPGALSVETRLLSIKDLPLPENLSGIRPDGSKDEIATREKLIVAAAGNLAEDGVAGISTRRIAARAGVNPALVHYHFGSIEELMLEVLRRIGIQSLLRLQSQYGSTNDFAQQWRDDIATTVDGEVAIGWGKAWIEIISFVTHADDALYQRFASDFGEPTYAIMRGAVLRDLGVDSERRDLDDEVDTIVALSLVVKTGLIISALLGQDRGRTAAVDIVSDVLRERLESMHDRLVD